MKKVNVTKTEKEIKGLQNNVKQMSNILDHLRSQNRILSKNIGKIFKIWDGFFKTLGVIISVAIVTGLIWLTRNIYCLNGKWDFHAVFFGGMIFLAILVGLIAGTWGLVNEILINKIECNK